jgi:hypothetical protein
MIRKTNDQSILQMCKEGQPIFPYDIFNLKKIHELEIENRCLRQRLHEIARQANFEPKESEDLEPF